MKRREGWCLGKARKGDRRGEARPLAKLTGRIWRGRFPPLLQGASNAKGTRAHCMLSPQSSLELASSIKVRAIRSNNTAGRCPLERHNAAYILHGLI